MTSTHKNQQVDTCFRVLRRLQDDPEMSQRDLAEAVGVSVGCINYVISALIESGLVKPGSLAAADDKRRHAYILTPEGIAQKAALARVFILRRIKEYESLGEEIKALNEEIEVDFFDAENMVLKS